MMGRKGKCTLLAEDLTQAMIVLQTPGQVGVSWAGNGTTEEGVITARRQLVWQATLQFTSLLADQSIPCRAKSRLIKVSSAPESTRKAAEIDS